MPVSISIGQAQAKGLKSGFLKTKGTDKGLFLTETGDALYLVAGHIVEQAHENLDAGGHTSSGNLAESIKTLNPEYQGKKIKVDIEALYYYAFINKGVRGTQSGAGVFAFKSKYPGRAMIANLMAGITSGTAKTTSINKQYTISKNEVKNATLSELSQAYGAAHKILKYGIAATSFFDKAVKTGEQEIKETLGSALKIDIINSLPNSL
jgi:hypothetical protein